MPPLTLPPSNNIVVTGQAGVGKTTLVKRIASELAATPIAGFVTEALLEGTNTIGFELVPFDGEPRKIAHRDFVARERVGAFGVDVASIDYVADTCLGTHHEPAVWLIDPINRATLMSPRFIAALKRILGSSRPVLATVVHDDVILRNLSKRAQVHIAEIDATNRNSVTRQLLSWATRHASR